MIPIIAMLTAPMACAGTVPLFDTAAIHAGAATACAPDDEP
jgi:hypothetical protein